MYDVIVTSFGHLSPWTYCNKPYTKHYRGGLKQYLMDYENAFAELIELGEANWDNDKIKIRKLNEELSSTNLTWLKTFTKGKSFEETTQILCDGAISTESHAKERANQQANQATTAQLAFMEREKWLQLPKDFRDIIIKWRKANPENRTEQQPDTTNNTPSSTTPNTNHTTTEDFEQEIFEALDEYSPEQLATIDEYLNESEESTDELEKFCSMASITPTTINTDDEGEIYFREKPSHDLICALYPKMDPKMTVDDILLASEKELGPKRKPDSPFPPIYTTQDELGERGGGFKTNISTTKFAKFALSTRFQGR